MINILLLLLAVSSSGFSLSDLNTPTGSSLDVHSGVISELPSISPQLNEIKDLLHAEAPSLRESVINKVLTSIKCATEYNVERNNILTIIDYSLPSNEKRLWVFDLRAKKLLFYTYVSHGIKSGALLTNYFSNKNDSKASSIGVYRTEKAYYGREGLSLRLEGLDRSFNDNAFNRSVVMHGGWYMDEQFIKRYGRPGRSWGCPALPLTLYQPIINTIKDASLFVVYYPDDDWFGKSKFLNCDKMNTAQKTDTSASNIKLSKANDEQREYVLYADISKNNNAKAEEPVLVMAADNYERIFHAKVPLERMLRRQINKAEYVALSNVEFNQLVAQNNREELKAVSFVIPVIHMVRGYYETQMQFVNLGIIKDIRLNDGPANNSNGLTKSYTVSFEDKPAVRLKSTNRFIRWVGL